MLGYLRVQKNGKDLDGLLYLPMQNAKEMMKETMAACPLEAIIEGLGKVKLGWDLENNSLQLLLNGLPHSLL